MVAALLRFTRLDSKPPWTDEFSTLVFSLGNSFKGVPIDRVITLSTLLAPLQPHPNVSIREVVHHLLSESNHPPAYFILAHEWMKLFGTSPDHLLFIARSLPAFLGVLLVPAIYYLGRFAFHSNLVGQWAAAMMAVSPYAVYLSQEARHYTLGILLVIASLGCLVVAINQIRNWAALPLRIGLIWTIINSLGIAVHYFFSLALCAEAIVLILLLWQRIQSQRAPGKPLSSYWTILASFLLPAVGTFAGGLVWLPVFLPNSYSSELTQWIQSSERTGIAWISPIFQALAGWITTISLLPVESSELPVIIVSVIVMVLFFLWALPVLKTGLKICYGRLESYWAVRIFIGYILAIITLFFGFTYILGIDLTRGARYNFVYFPAVIVLVGASLAAIFNTPFINSQWFNFPVIKIEGKKAVTIIWLMGLISGITVVANLGYQKYYRPDLLTPIIEEVSQAPILIATTHKTHVQTGELMGIAWQWAKDHPQNSPDSSLPKFLLAHEELERPGLTLTVLNNELQKLESPLDVWLINFHTPETVALQNCVKDTQPRPAIDGYNYQLYHCLQSS